MLASSALVEVLRTWTLSPLAKRAGGFPWREYLCIFSKKRDELRIE